MALPWVCRGPVSQKPCACLVGRKEQNNTGGIAPTGKMKLGDTCYRKRTVRGGEELLQRGYGLGTAMLEILVPSRSGVGLGWERRSLVLSDSRGRKKPPKSRRC